VTWRGYIGTNPKILAALAEASAQFAEDAKAPDFWRAPVKPLGYRLVPWEFLTADERAAKLADICRLVDLACAANVRFDGMTDAQVAAANAAHYREVGR